MTLSTDEKEVKTESKVNPVAKEASAPKADTMPSQIKASQEKVQKRKDEDAKRKPNHSDMMKSMRKQTVNMLKAREAVPQLKPKPRSFPDPTFKPK